MKMKYKQEPPNSLQLEPTEGCNLACSFCSMHSIRPKGAEYSTFKMMELSTVKHVANMVKEAGWNPRWEIAMHGEPTLHPELHKIVKAVRKRLPNAYILLTSNGVPLLRDEEGKEEKDEDKAYALFETRIDRLFRAGANTIAIDNYGYLRDKVAKHARNYNLPGVAVGEYPDGGPDFNPHPRSKKNKLVIVADISEASTGTHSNLTNQGGTAFESSFERQDQRCAKPFREIAVRWNGDVAVCCDSWDGWGQIGNVNNYEDIEDLWQHPYFDAFRKMLYHEGRNAGPCYGCNVRSYRVGLLPDHKGKVDMPAFSKKDEANLKECLNLGPTSPIFTQKRRPWLEERKGRAESEAIIYSGRKKKEKALD